MRCSRARGPVFASPRFVYSLQDAKEQSATPFPPLTFPPEDSLQLICPLNGISEIFWIEIPRTPIALGEFRVLGQLPAKAAFVKRHSCDHANVQLLARWKKFILRRLIENVVDHLHRIHKPGSHRLDPVPWLPSIQAQAEGANRSVFLQFLYRLAEIGFVGPAIVPDMKLQHVD